MNLNNYQESIFFLKLEEKHFSKIKEFFTKFKSEKIKNISIQIQAKDKYIEDFCEKYDIVFNFDIYQNAVQLNLIMDYNIQEFNLDLSDIESEDDLYEIASEQINDIISTIEDELLKFIGYDEYDYYEIV